MRKDVQFGLTIGGSLVAVLIIGFAVFDRGSARKQEMAVGPTTGPSDSGQAVVSTDVTAAAPITHMDSAPATLPAMVADTTSSTARDWSRLLQGGGPTTQPLTTLSASTPVDVTEPQAISQAGVTTQPVADIVAAGPTRTHKVAAGETFYTISAAVYGDSKHFNLIEDANPKVNPNKLRVGTVLKIPDLGSTGSRTGAMAVTAGATETPLAGDAAPGSADTTPARAELDKSKNYRVQPSDTLMAIARKLYGNGSAWQKIYDANKDTIGPNPARLKVNMVLRLPDPPAAAGVN